MSNHPLTAAERQFVFSHARHYARPDIDPDRAEAYAEWYLARYAGPHNTLGDLPAHSSAWPQFQDQYQAPELAAEFPTLDAFYTADLRRKTSPESDYGVHWRDGSSGCRWRVSYIQDTGEVYAVTQGCHGNPVRVLGVVPADETGCYYRTLDEILAGWADPDVSGFDLAWVTRRLGDRLRQRPCPGCGHLTDAPGPCTACSTGSRS